MNERATAPEAIQNSSMLQDKIAPDVEVVNIDTNQDYHHAENGEDTLCTPTDVTQMRRMGKPQQLVRHFRLWSITSLVAIATAAWELAMFLITPGLVDGGRAGLMYSSIWSFVLSCPIYISMAELASMAPIAGSQYHWVSEFAPEEYQRILSYLIGWTSTLAWQSGNALGLFLVGSVFQVIISINLPDYAFPAWQGTLLVIGSVLIAVAGIIFGSKILHLWQVPVMIIHLACFLLFLVPIWVKVPAVSHAEVWTKFENYGGWSSMTLSVLAGQLTGISGQAGYDTAAHMSEEVQDAGRQVPRAMLTVWLLNNIISFIAILTLAYHIDDVGTALTDNSSYPAVYVLRRTWGPAGVTAILVITNVLLIASNISYIAAVTRDLFAFARDQGLPFSAWLSTVDSKRAIPTNAALVSGASTILLSLIYIGSPVAFYAITSLCTVTFYQCYLTSIACILWRRIKHPESLPHAPFSLGKWGVPINAAAVVSCIWCFFWSFWPQYSPVTAADFNWASPIYGATFVVAMVYFVFWGRKRYFGPVRHVEGRKVQ